MAKPLDPAKFAPLTREVLKARDEIMAVLAGLGDDRKAAVALTYASATFLKHLSKVSRQPEETCALTYAREIYRTLGVAVMTTPVAW